jgi:pimeloyl-ACP methyl ester carboxylesterase
MNNSAAVTMARYEADDPANKEVSLSASIDGTTISYKKSGAGPPLVFFHGWIGNEDTFGFCHEAFARHFTVYRPAWPGYGASGPLGQFSIEHLVELGRGFIRALGYDRVTLFGNCLGGNTAMEFARLYPEMIERMVLIEVYDFVPWYLHLLLVPGLNSFLYRMLLRSMTGFHLLNSFLPLQVAGGSNGLRYTEEGFRRTPVSTAIAFMKAIHNFARRRRDFYHTQYRCAVPTIYVEGGRSFGPVKAFRDVVERYFGNLHIVSIPESLHNPVMERPDLFIERVLPLVVPPTRR